MHVRLTSDGSVITDGFTASLLCEGGESGDACGPGFTNSTDLSESVGSPCTEAPCPAGSEGSGVVSGCTLMAGYVGNLTATTNA
eukprot:SAG31_NODE_809_length_11922_cov_15.915504_10_plen_83_part_01